MRIKYLLFSLTCSFFITCTLGACSYGHNYISNDPDAAPGAPQYYNINDLLQDYHLFFKPSQGWVGDPIPFYAQGKFHIFYLYDARNGASTFHPWHEVSTSDFFHFHDDGEMIACGNKDQQDGALGTGSVIEYKDNYYAFYTGHNDKLDPKEKIMLATSSDLKTWKKESAFSMQAKDGYDRDNFRDPFVYKDRLSQKFVMLIATRADYKGSWRSVIACYTSTDLRNWELQTPLYDNEQTFMMECPDFFEMNNYQYLIYSDINDRMVHYRYRRIGSTEWQSPVDSNLDGIAYYAAKTVSDGKNRFLTGWCPTRQSSSDDNAFDWGGSLVTHQLNLNADGTLNITIPRLISEAVKDPTALQIVSQTDHTIKTSDHSFTLDAIGGVKQVAIFQRLSGITKINTTIHAASGTKFGIELASAGNRREVFELRFDVDQKHLELEHVERLMQSENLLTSVPLSIPSDQVYHLTLIIENAVCTAYINNRQVFTNRICLMNQNPFGIFCSKGKVRFEQLEIYK